MSEANLVNTHPPAVIAFALREDLPALPPMTPQPFVQRGARFAAARNSIATTSLSSSMRTFAIRSSTMPSAPRATGSTGRCFAAMAGGSVWPSSRRSHEATSSIDLISHF